MAISRLGINTPADLATGRSLEQMFQATTDVVDRKMREVWNKSTEIAGICHVLAVTTPAWRRTATLTGLGCTIGLPILTYAEGSQRAAVGLHQPEPCDRAHPSR